MAEKAIRARRRRAGSTITRPRRISTHVSRTCGSSSRQRGTCCTRSTRLEVREVAVVMKVGNAFLKKAGCVSPHMTFEFRKYAEAKARARSVAVSKRRLLYRPDMTVSARQRRTRFDCRRLPSIAACRIVLARGPAGHLQLCDRRVRAEHSLGS